MYDISTPRGESPRMQRPYVSQQSQFHADPETLVPPPPPPTEVPYPDVKTPEAWRFAAGQTEAGGAPPLCPPEHTCATEPPPPPPPFPTPEFGGEVAGVRRGVSSNEDPSPSAGDSSPLSVPTTVRPTRESLRLKKPRGGLMGGPVFVPMPSVAAPGVNTGSPEWRVHMEEWNAKKDEEKERLRVATIGFPTSQVHEKLPVRF